jgi:hypothetical protein
MRNVDYRADKEFVGIAALSGLTFSKVEQFSDGQIEFETGDGRVFVMLHFQDCCESVGIESIVGDLSDLVGEPIIVAEEVTGETAQPVGWQPYEYSESFSWTFYKLATRKGYVDIRWFGVSNGYYSESVDLVELKNPAA